MALDPIVGGIVAGVLFLVAVFYRRGTLIAPHRVAIGTGIGVPLVETPVSLAGVTRVALVTTSEVSHFWQDSSPWPSKYIQLSLVVLQGEEPEVIWDGPSRHLAKARRAGEVLAARFGVPFVDATVGQGWRASGGSTTSIPT